MRTIDERIQHAAAPSDLDAARRDRLWDATCARISAPAPLRGAGARRARPLKPLLVAAAVVLATGGVAFGASERVRSAVTGTATDAIDVFRGQEHTTPLSPETESLVDQIQSWHKDGTSPFGRLRPTEGRALATSTRGDVSASVSAVPSDANDLCLALTITIDGAPSPDGNGMACIGPLSADRPIGNIGATNSTTYKTLGGIALDEVTAIDIFVDGEWEPVELTGHAFAWVAPSPAAKVGALRATMADGGTVVVATI